VGPGIEEVAAVTTWLSENGGCEDIKSLKVNIKLISNLNVTVRIAGEKEVVGMGMEHDSPRPLLESSGWLAAHRRSQRSLERNPVHFRTNSISGEASSQRPAKGLACWHSWSLGLFSRFPLPARDHPRITEG
jgi:hypothetical protein